MLKLETKQSDFESHDLLAEYDLLDSKLSNFRITWNRQARQDIQYSLKSHRSRGKQKDFPLWWYQDVRRWKELKLLLNL